MSAIIKPRYTLEEYFELERNSEEKYGYFDGEVFCMSGVSPEHSLLEGNLVTLLNNALKERGCRVYTSNLRVKTVALPPYRYPDLSVVCEPPRFEEIGGLRALTNPLLIIEILSPSTEAFDRGDKFTYYKSIPSFCEYVLVAQHRPHITHYVKQDDGKWSYEELNGVSNSIFLATLNCALSLSDIYHEVEFHPDASSPNGLTPVESK